MGNNTEYAFIWDMDGTLIDSYGAIVKSVKRTYAEYGIETDADEIRRVCMKYSVSYFLELLASGRNRHSEAERNRQFWSKRNRQRISVSFP